MVSRFYKTDDRLNMKFWPIPNTMTIKMNYKIFFGRDYWQSTNQIFSFFFSFFFC